MASYSQDAFATALIQKLTIFPSADPKFSLKAGVLRKGTSIWVGADPVLHQQIVGAFHDSPLGGHSGFPFNYRKIR